MGLIKEPKNIDLSTKSEPWTENELADFRKLMEEIKAKNEKQQLRSSATKQQAEKKRLNNDNFVNQESTR